MQMDRHHLLEIILWPNGDGTFREILNSKSRLKELGIYDDWKMCIEIPHDEHTRLHHSGSRHHLFGKRTPPDVCKKLSMAMIGKEHPRWKGDMASDKTKKRRKDPCRSPESRRLRKAKRKAAAQLRAAAGGT